MKTVEAVARAIHHKIFGSDVLWRESEDAAREAIKAMRFPTQKMYDAAFGELVPWSDAKAAWMAMIEAALEEYK